jgi:hypothetical protein
MSWNHETSISHTTIPLCRKQHTSVREKINDCRWRLLLERSEHVILNMQNSDIPSPVGRQAIGILSTESFMFPVRKN